MKLFTTLARILLWSLIASAIYFGYVLYEAGVFSFWNYILGIFIAFVFFLALQYHELIEELMDIGNQDTVNPIFEKTIHCKSCNSTLAGRGLAERFLRGAGGAGVGGAAGLVIGSFILPPLGIFLGTIGAATGSNAGKQISPICERCCSVCIKRKTECICLEIIAYCTDCGDPIARKNYSGNCCQNCSEQIYGEDI